MGLLGRQIASTYVNYDDQGPGLWGNYVGNWSRYGHQGYTNGTFTATPTPGASLSLAFSGSQIMVYGGIFPGSDNSTSRLATANYIVDNVASGPQAPTLYNGWLYLCFQTPILQDGTHTIKIIVTTANDTNPFVLDWITVVMGVHSYNPSATPASTSTKPTPVGAIVGGVFGGIAGIAILIIAVYYFLRMRARDRQDDYNEKPGPDEAFPGEYRVEPYNETAFGPPPPAGPSRPDSQLVFPGGSSNQPLSRSAGRTAVSSHTTRHTQSNPNEAGLRYASGDSPRTRTQKVDLVAQQYENVQQFAQSQESRSSELSTEYPPTYRPD